MRSYSFIPDGSLLEELLAGATIVKYYAKPSEKEKIAHVLIEIAKHRRQTHTAVGVTADGEPIWARFVSYQLVEVSENEYSWCEMVKTSESKVKAKQYLLEQYRDAMVIEASQNSYV